MSDHFDVVVVGAGLSGIGAACHLREKCPNKSFAILEGRDAIGGTWDLFRYPGIRSDSDMYTLGYDFKPWKGAKAIADGPSILDYIRETATEHGIENKIRFGHKVVRAAWSSERASWTLDVERGPSKERLQLTCNFLQVCSGYYDYAAGYTPELPGIERFKGRIVHPQKWSEDIDYENKRVIVIGSGATAMTLVPELSKKAAHVVMLQRSPTYVISAPAKDRFAIWLRKFLAEPLVYGFIRWRNVLLQLLFFLFARRFPLPTKRALVARVRQELGPGYDVSTHFTPRYGVWDQRLCLVPDSDLFEAIRGERASVVTDHIETLTERGIRLRSGQELEADLIVTATGLELLFLGGIALEVDGKRVDLSRTMNYKGALLSDVPNLSCTFGYTNASWTLKADLTADYVCRLLQHMDAIGARQATPRRKDPDLREESFLDFTSGYVQRAMHKFPKQGSKRPWRLYQNYPLDVMTLRYGAIDDGVLEFSNPQLGREREVLALPETIASP
ncbi:MAG: flavin-containing monooxygenase [Polyangiales bacterium]